MNSCIISIPVKKGTHLSCSIEERWEQILFRPVLCGAKFSQTVRRKTGVLLEQRENLKATIKGLLGIKGLAQLESAIQSETGISIKFEDYNEVEQTYEVTAPERGRHVVNYSQKKQLLHFQGRDSKFFWNASWNITVHRWLEQYLDESMRYEVDPACGHPATPPPPPDGKLAFVVESGKLTMVTPYWIKHNGIEFGRLGLRADVDLSDIISSRIQLPSDAFPQETQQICGIKIKDKHIDAIVMHHGRTMGEFQPSQYQYCFPDASKTFIPITSVAPPIQGESEEGMFYIEKRPTAPMQGFSFGQTSPGKLYMAVDVQDIKRMWSEIEKLPLISMKSIDKKYL